MRLGWLSGAPGIQARACPSSPVPIWGQVGGWGSGRSTGIKRRGMQGARPQRSRFGVTGATRRLSSSLGFYEGAVLLWEEDFSP